MGVHPTSGGTWPGAARTWPSSSGPYPGDPGVFPSPLLSSPLFVAAGDSITANGASLSASVANISGRGYWCWAAQKSRQRIRPDYQVNAGVSGNTSTQLLARYDTDVIAKAPKVVLLLIGTNDIVTAGAPAATILSNIDAMIVKNRAIGAVTILGKVLPRLTAASPMTAPQIAVWEATNAGIAQRAASDVLVWDAESVVGSGDASHSINQTYFSDATHPNTIGCQAIGDVVAPLIESITLNVDPLFTVNNASGNLVPNGFMTGTSGALSGGATGSVATSFAGTASAAGGATVVMAKVARSDGFGEWQQITVSGTYTGTSRNTSVNRSVSSLSVASGNFIQASVEFEVDAGHSALSSVSVLCTLNGGSYSMEAMSPFAGDTGSPSGAYSGIAKTQPFLAAATITSLQIFVRVSLKDTASTDAAAAVVRFGRLEVRSLGTSVT